MVKGRQCKI